MRPKRPHYGKFALQAFVVFGALGFLWRGPLIWPWLAMPVGLDGRLLAALEHGILGVVIVTILAAIIYEIILPRRSQP
jgi:hypothetical protein